MSCSTTLRALLMACCAAGIAPAACAPAASVEDDASDSAGPDTTSTGGTSSEATSSEATSSGATSSDATSTTAGSGESETMGTTATSNGTGSSAGSDSSTTGSTATVVSVRYLFGDTTADCAAAEASWVDVYISDRSGPLPEYSVEDLDCDDAPVELPPMPAGSYSLSVVAWDLNLWEGEADFTLDGSSATEEIDVQLVVFPNP